MTRNSLYMTRWLLWGVIISGITLVGLTSAYSYQYGDAILLLMQVSIAIGLACVSGAACLFASERGQSKLLMTIGVYCSVIGGTLVVAGVIWEMTGGTLNTTLNWVEWIFPLGWILLIASLAIAQRGMLRLLVLRTTLARVSRGIAYGAALFFFLVFVGRSLYQNGPWDYSETLEIVVLIGLLQAGFIAMSVYYRRPGRRFNRFTVYFGLTYVLVLGHANQWGWVRALFDAILPSFGGWWYSELALAATLIAVTCTGIVPIMALLELVNRRLQRGSMPVTGIVINLTCPRCGRVQDMVTGAGMCADCRLKIRLEIEEPRCECGYLLFKLTGETCPECGRQVKVIKSKDEPAENPTA